MADSKTNELITKRPPLKNTLNQLQDHDIQQPITKNYQN